MSGMNCTVEDIVRLCRQCQQSEAREASEMKDERDKHFCLGMASAYKHVVEHIESRKLCKPNSLLDRNNQSNNGQDSQKASSDRSGNDSTNRRIQKHEIHNRTDHQRGYRQASL